MKERKWKIKKTGNRRWEEIRLKKMGMLCLRETMMNMIAESLQKKYKKEDKSMDANTYLPSARDVSDKDLSSSKNISHVFLTKIYIRNRCWDICYNGHHASESVFL